MQQVDKNKLKPLVDITEMNDEQRKWLKGIKVELGYFEEETGLFIVQALR